MAKPLSPCSKCKGEMAPTMLEPYFGAEGEVKLTIQAMPALICPQGHKRFVYPEFAAMLMDLVMNPETYAFLPGARAKGLFRKRFHCPDCGKELAEAPSGRHVEKVSASFRKSEAFEVGIDLPVYRCEGCKKHLLRSAEEAGRLAFKAIGHAYRSIDIHPS